MTFTDLDGLCHTAELEADTVYEAAVLALQIFKKSEFVQIPPGLASRFQVNVRGPVVSHEVSLVQVRDWVNRGSGNPAEILRRNRLKEMLDACLPKV